MKSDYTRSTLVERPIWLVEQLGHFHDMRINGMNLDVAKKVLRLEVEDLLINFEGLTPQYRELPGAIEFLGLRELDCTLDLRDGLRIQAADGKEVGTLVSFKFQLNEGIGNVSSDYVSLRVLFGEMHVHGLREVMNFLLLQ